jgi:hypothetical protein
MVLTCVTCRSESFDETETGFFVCVRCGTQSQDVVREVEDEEMAFNSLAGRGARGRRIGAGATPGGGDARDATNAPLPPRGAVGGAWNLSSAAATTATKHAARAAAAAAAARNTADVYEQVVAYCEGIQRLIHAQCVTLATDFGCPPELPEVAKAIWFPYLRATGLLDIDFNDPDAYLAPKRPGVRARAAAAAASVAAAGGGAAPGAAAAAGGGAAGGVRGAGDGELGALDEEDEEEDDDDDDEEMDEEERERRRRRRRRREKRRRRREREEEEEEEDDDHDHDGDGRAEPQR